MRAVYLVIAGVTLGLLSGCSKGPYSTAILQDGTVLLVNTYTGSVDRITGGTLEELGETRIISPTSYRPTLAPAFIPKQPFRVVGRARYLTNSMAVIVDLAPNQTPKTPTGWIQWRSHLIQCRSSGRLVLQFTDKDGFKLASEQVSLSDMHQLVDANSDLIGLGTQISVPIAGDLYKDISGWNVEWAGFPSVAPPSGHKPPLAAPQ